MRRGDGEDDARHHRRIPRADEIDAARFPMTICYSDDDEEIDLKSPSEIVALHAACRDRITEYDPKKRARVLTRFCGVNLAGFDLDRESKVGLGPLLEDVTPQLWKFRAETSYNVVSVKIIESDLGYPISVFGTVLARDTIDYRCVYLFRRERDDPQIISSKVVRPFVSSQTI
uniref:DUF6598 domain-containing protein n=1 Tax=Aegilops tauschii subsp. strangulata TaxID=200361 RepID=A0A453E7Z2_AEGTS